MAFLIVYLFQKVAATEMGMKVVDAPETPNPEDFEEFTEDMNRFRDSENKMLIEMDKDLLRLNVKSIEIEIESTFSPYVMCRREILLRNQIHKTRIAVKSPKFRNTVGEIEEVKTNVHFKEYLRQNQ